MSDNQSSTLKSYVDSATGTVQSALGSLTGNTGDQVSTFVSEYFHHGYYTPPAYDPRCSQQYCLSSLCLAVSFPAL